MVNGRSGGRQTVSFMSGDSTQKPHNYPYEVATPTADLLTVKLLLNCVISMEGARFCSVDIKNFYLCPPLKRVCPNALSDFPEDVIEQYGLLSWKFRLDWALSMRVLLTDKTNKIRRLTSTHWLR
jgi:hypothetical protein